MNNISVISLLGGALRQAAAAPRVGKGLAAMLINRPGRHMSIGRLIEQIAERSPAQLAIRTRESGTTYAELNAAANQLCHALQAAGIGTGDSVLVGTGNTPETLIVVTAIVKLGAIAALLPSAQSGDALAHSVSLTGSTIAICDADMADKLDACNATLTVRWATEPGPSGWTALSTITNGRSRNNPASTCSVQLQQACYYIFTSGTTGLPKASVMTHYRFFASLRGMGDAVVRLPRGGTLYCPLPLYHNNGLTVSWGVVLAAGGALAIVPKFSASRFWDDIRQFDAQAFCYIGELCRYLLAQPPSNDDCDNPVEVMVGNGLRPELWHAFKNRFQIDRVAEFYGASESNIAFVNAFNQDQTAGYCPLPHAVVAFDTANAAPLRNRRGKLQKVKKGEPGLLISRVHALAQYDGYTDDAASESKLIRNAFRRGDCWFNTGDVVRQQGFGHIQFVDRLGDTFRWKGENVSTTEVERALTAFVGVDDAVVYGVPVDGADGKAGMAALTVSDEFQLESLLQHVQDRLPGHAVPQYLRLCKALDTTGTFKHQKQTLRDEAYDTRRTDDPLYQLNRDHYEPVQPPTSSG